MCGCCCCGSVVNLRGVVEGVGLFDLFGVGRLLLLLLVDFGGLLIVEAEVEVGFDLMSTNMSTNWWSSSYLDNSLNSDSDK